VVLLVQNKDKIEIYKEVARREKDCRFITGLDEKEKVARLPGVGNRSPGGTRGIRCPPSKRSSALLRKEVQPPQTLAQASIPHDLKHWHKQAYHTYLNERLGNELAKGFLFVVAVRGQKGGCGGQSCFVCAGGRRRARGWWKRRHLSCLPEFMGKENVSGHEREPQEEEASTDVHSLLVASLFLRVLGWELGRRGPSAAVFSPQPPHPLPFSTPALPDAHRLLFFGCM